MELLLVLEAGYDPIQLHRLLETASGVQREWQYYGLPVDSA
jgi:hypothetical protein